jgi:hypothetical protein
MHEVIPQQLHLDNKNLQKQMVFSNTANSITHTAIKEDEIL